MDSTAKQQIVERVKQASNILVTVSNDPSVDQLAACIGLTLLLNKMDKHATAVFSGNIPSTIEFLQPEKTIESNTNSLQDFIISLDKSKADKLRYKVEDQVVRIFITPYRTSLSEKDLVFSQGDFNVEVVLALGVSNKQQLDKVITEHGRILHDATVACFNAGSDVKADIGQLNWTDPAASSLCEMIMSISEAFGSGLVDNQIATAFLTGIVAKTERFSNDKTSPKVMTMSAQLMAAGANQQLIATKLQETFASAQNQPQNQFVQPDQTGNLQITHDDTFQQPAQTPPQPEPQQQYQVPNSQPLTAGQPPTAPPEDPGSRHLLPSRQPEQLFETAYDEQPNERARQLLTNNSPSFGGYMNASTQGDGDNEPPVDPMSQGYTNTPMLDRASQPAQDQQQAPTVGEMSLPEPVEQPYEPELPNPNQTVSELSQLQYEPMESEQGQTGDYQTDEYSQPEQFEVVQPPADETQYEELPSDGAQTGQPDSDETLSQIEQEVQQAGDMTEPEVINPQLPAEQQEIEIAHDGVEEAQVPEFNPADFSTDAGPAAEPLTEGVTEPSEPGVPQMPTETPEDLDLSKLQQPVGTESLPDTTENEENSEQQIVTEPVAADSTPEFQLPESDSGPSSDELPVFEPSASSSEFIPPGVPSEPPPVPPPIIQQ